MNYVLAFAAGTLVDLFYVRWVVHVQSGLPFRAAASSMAVGACGILGVTGVVRDHWTAIPYLLGLGVGTYLGMSRENKV